MMIFIPTPLRAYAGGKDSIDVAAGTIAEALTGLTAAHPELQKHLFSSEGKLRAFVNLYFNDEDVRYLPEKEATAVSATDTLSIIPSIAGGTRSLTGRFCRLSSAIPGLKGETWGTQTFVEWMTPTG
jgi:adenylyltransferase/sulfurtransferase